MVALSGAGGVVAADAEDDMHFDEMFDRRESGESPRARRWRPKGRRATRRPPNATPRA